MTPKIGEELDPNLKLFVFVDSNHKKLLCIQDGKGTNIHPAWTSIDLIKGALKRLSRRGVLPKTMLVLPLTLDELDGLVSKSPNGIITINPRKEFEALIALSSRDLN